MFAQRNKFLRKIVYKIGKSRAKDMVNKIKLFIKLNDSILDIGSGTCNICEVLLNKGYNLTPLDIQDLSFVNNIKPIIYDGTKIPFKDNEFDKSLILTVLHHTPEPEKILNEAKRVSKRIIVTEDIYSNKIHKYLTYFFDSLLNLEFTGHPHTNKSNKEWKKTFEKLGLKLLAAKYSTSFIVFRHATYYLEK